jgi:hypothetical protein
MNPEAVLNEDQKKIRFRKLLRKRLMLLTKLKEAKQSSLLPNKEAKIVDKEKGSDEAKSENSADCCKHLSRVDYNVVLPRRQQHHMPIEQPCFFFSNPYVSQNHQLSIRQGPSMEVLHQYRGQSPHEKDHLVPFQPEYCDSGTNFEIDFRSAGHLPAFAIEPGTPIEAKFHSVNTFRPDEDGWTSHHREIVDTFISVMESQR